MESIEQSASGTFPVEFSFLYESEFDPSSPWSLCLAFLPETSALPHSDFVSCLKPKDERTRLEPAVANYVKMTTAQMGWTESNKDPGDKIDELFLKARLRRTDDVCRQMDIPASLHLSDNTWVDGIVRVLQLYRRFTGDAGADFTLNEFENADPAQNFARLIAVEPPHWDLRQRLEFLVLPYSRYVNHIEFVQQYLLGQDLPDVMSGLYISELVSSVSKVCLNAPAEEWQYIKKVAENATPCDGGPTIVETIDILYQPYKASLTLFADLSEAAQLNKFPGVLFKQFAEWTLSSASTQRDSLVRFLHTSHFLQNEINILRKSIFRNIDEPTIVRECVKSSSDQSRFMFIKTNLLQSQYRDIVVEEILSLAEDFEREPKTTDLSRALTALDLIEDGHNTHVIELKKKFTDLNKAYKAFGLEPGFVLTHDHLENVSMASRSDPQAYSRYTELVNIVGGGPTNGSAVAERCVEAALADDNFSVAVEFFDRKFVSAESSDTAWLAFYQAGKYMSPDWDLPRPKSVLTRQRELLSSALLNCKENDSVSVLRAWTSIDEELASYSSRSTSTADSVKEANTSRSSLLASEERVRSQSPAAHLNVDAAKDQLSTIFKHGIGWVVGANPPP